MELPRIKKSEHGMLDGIKSKLGFADAASSDYHEEYYDDYGNADDDYGDYAEDLGEFSEYGPDYNEGAASGSRYDPYAPITTRPPRSARSSRSTRSSSRTDSSMPKLVSIGDVRAHTQVPDSLNRDPLPPRRVSSAAATSAYRGERTMVDATQPAPSSPAHVAASRDRSEGLDSLFSSTADAAASGAAAPSGRSSSASVTSPLDTSPAGGGSGTGSFDPYDAYAGTGVASHNPSRSLSVLKPSSYAEVERVAKQLKAGDAVILALRNTPDNLAKRILDFSFGVASALDARVECIADKVFAVTRGSHLSEAERLALRNQGVL